MAGLGAVEEMYDVAEIHVDVVAVRGLEIDDGRDLDPTVGSGESIGSGV